MKHLALVSGVSLAFGCSPAAEPARVELDVVIDMAGVGPVETDLGYVVEVSEARLVIENLEFAVASEAHEATLWQRLGNLLVPEAHAHPGHDQGGDVTGVLEGRFVLGWPPRASGRIGTATLIAGEYESANFTFSRAREQDGIDAADPLLGHTALLAGRIRGAAGSTEFTIVLDAPEDRELVGAPFRASIGADATGNIGFALLLRAPETEMSLFDGIDFSSMTSSAGGAIEIGPGAAEPAIEKAYDVLRRACLTHDFFRLSAAAAD